MKKLFLACSILFVFVQAKSQTLLDTSNGGASVIIKDSRIVVLEEKLETKNTTVSPKEKTNTAKVGNKTVIKTTSSGVVLVPGYKLMVISTPDRDLAMKVRSLLYQNFSEKQQLIFQMPNTKIKFGNFLSREAANQARKKILALKIVTNNIYIVSETVEMKVQKSEIVEGEEELKPIGKDTKKTKAPTKTTAKTTKPKK